ncbi:integral membrane sensor signal transduction histidine kinase [Candidatus Magnetoovum chiemensis]|nr:integral membrane sensor signal transduction histidine kinase [Candidatus Magnetoovum chiemensis]
MAGKVDKYKTIILKAIGSTRISALYNIGISALFIIAAAVIILIINYSERKQALQEAESKALILLNRNLATHAYFTKQLKPAVFKVIDPEKLPDYFDPIWMSSTYAVREIDKEFRSLTADDYYYKECAINARSPENEADEYEMEFLEELNRDPKLTYRSKIREINGVPYFTVLRRGETMEAICLYCHSTPQNAPNELVRIYGPHRSFNRKIGDAVHAISIRVSLSLAYKNANRLTLIIAVVLLTFMGIIFAIQYFVGRHLIFKPLNKVKDKAFEISKEADRLGETIPLPLGRELHELTSAFNKMSIDLKRNKEELEDYKDSLEKRVHEEIEKSKQQEQLLIQQSKLAAMGEMINAIAHQWRQPLNAVGVIVQDIKDAYFYNELNKDYLSNSIDSAMQQLSYMSKTIDDFRNFLRPSKEKETFDVKALVAEALSLFEAQFKVHNISCRLSCKAHDRSVINSSGLSACEDIITSAYKSELKQVIINLINNSKDAIFTKRQQSGETSHEGVISFDFSTKDSYIIIRMSDNGCGIDSDILYRVFEPYFTTKFESQGTGLGLYMSKIIVENNIRGRIYAENSKDGAVFIIELPKAAS